MPIRSYSVKVRLQGKGRALLVGRLPWRSVGLDYGDLVVPQMMGRFSLLLEAQTLGNTLWYQRWDLGLVDVAVFRKGRILWRPFGEVKPPTAWEVLDEDDDF
jgi:hypothetical protein